jgi:hypothetical protein
MICGTCRGSGNLVNWQQGRLEYWTCQPCGGSGVRIQYGPALHHQSRPLPYREERL